MGDGVIGAHGVGGVHLELQRVAGDTGGKSAIIALCLSGVEGQGALQGRAGDGVLHTGVNVRSAHIVQHRAELHLGPNLGVSGLHGAGSKALEGGYAHVGGGKGGGLAQQPIHGGCALIDAIVQPLLLFRRLPEIFLHGLDLCPGFRQPCPCRLNVGHVKGGAGGTLDLLKGIQGGIKAVDDFGQHPAHAIIQGHLRFYRSH